MADPEKLAREEIDALLGPCGWTVQDKNAVNLSAARGVAVRELTFKTGEPDYTLFVDGKAIGTIERPNPRAIHLPVSRSNPRSTSKAFLSAFPHGGRLYLSLTSPPAPKPALPIGSIQYRAVVTYLPFTVRRRCSTGWKRTLVHKQLIRSPITPTGRALC